ncbi:hypothetical protein ACHQM5_025799 [Ranunculus cassubicifolius]
MLVGIPSTEESIESSVTGHSSSNSIHNRSSDEVSKEKGRKTWNISLKIGLVLFISSTRSCHLHVHHATLRKFWELLTTRRPTQLFDEGPQT